MTTTRHRPSPARARRAVVAGLLALVPAAAVIEPGTAVTAASCSSYTADERLPLERCDRGEAVRAVQERLNQLTTSRLVADGLFGPATEAAVTAFQRQQGLEVDGVVGPATWGLLEELSSTCREYEQVSQLPMSLCDSGLLVARLQQLLNESGVPAVPVDGYFGPVTLEAVMRFENGQGLVVDGAVDPVTWWELHTT